MQKIEAQPPFIDGALEARASGREVEGEEVIVAESLGELREEGILDGVRRAAGIATGHLQWRPRGELPCLREGGDGQGCRYVVIVKRRAGERRTEVRGVRGDTGDAGQRAGGQGGEAGGAAHASAPRPKVQVTMTRAGTLTGRNGVERVLGSEGV